MRYHQQNEWFHSSELVRAATEIHRMATTVHTHWLDHSDVKYVSMRIDQRTGDFCIQDGSGNKLAPVQVYAVFPRLRDPGELFAGEDPIVVSVQRTGLLPGEDPIVAAGVRPYPE
jgi:hypothetical protein